MNNNVIISIKGRQLYAEGIPEEMELVTSGTMKRDGADGYTVTYQESELTGLEGTTTRLLIKNGQVTLLREGNINSQMVFEEGRRHLSMYETPYGALSVGVSTKRMHSTLCEAGGDLEIDYAIEIDNLIAGQNLFRMNVKKNPALGVPFFREKKEPKMSFQPAADRMHLS